MGKATFPETNQESVKPADGGSRSASDVRNALSALFQGDASPLRPRAQSTPDMTVYVNPAVIAEFFNQIWLGVETPLSFVGGSSPAATAPVSNTRIDLLTIDSSGTLAWTQGVEGVTPVPPVCPQGKSAICYVYCRTTMTKIVNFEEKDVYPDDGYIYRDVRPFLNLGEGGVFLGLSDTPETYSGHGNKVVRVNSGETALEFIQALLSLLGDVEITSPANDHVLRYETPANKWKNKALTVSDEKVKASSGDATAGYLDAKVDNVTIEVVSNLLRLKDAGIPYSKLKTSTGEVSMTTNGQVLLPGGEYGFCPQYRVDHTGGDPIVCFGYDPTNTTYGTYAGVLYYYAGGSPVYFKQRYITSSGKDLWVFLLLDKNSKDVLGMYAAPDHPSYGSGGDPDKVPHPFGNYDPAKHEIIILDKTTGALLNDESALMDKSILNLIAEWYRPDMTQTQVYEPLHSGKFINQEAELIQSLPAYITVRKLIKLTAIEKQKREDDLLAAQQSAEQAKIDKANNLQSAKTKLQGLGLTADEVKAVLNE